MAVVKHRRKEETMAAVVGGMRARERGSSLGGCWFYWGWRSKGRKEGPRVRSFVRSFVRSAASSSSPRPSPPLDFPWPSSSPGRFSAAPLREGANETLGVGIDPRRRPGDARAKTPGFGLGLPLLLLLLVLLARLLRCPVFATHPSIHPRLFKPPNHRSAKNWQKFAIFVTRIFFYQRLFSHF